MVRPTHAITPLLARGSALARRWGGPWFWSDVLLPMLGVRLALLAAGWLSQIVLPNPKYPVAEAVERGWHFSQSRLLDMWARWDTGWYFGIIRAGYFAEADWRTSQSTNLAFFPLYPSVVGALVALMPERMRTDERILIVGLLVSQLFLAAALLVLHKLVTRLYDRETARRAVVYTLLFPTGFILFCLYTESTFLLFSVAALYAASRRAWAAAGVCGALLGLTRPLGVVVLAPLAWMYMESIEWKPARARLNVLWLALVPLGLVAFLAYAHRVSGDWLAPFHAQEAWGKRAAPPWETLLYPVGGEILVTRVEQVMTVAFLALAVWALFKLPSAAYGIYALLLVAPPLLSGTLISTSRYYVVVTPVFVALALVGRRADVDAVVKLAFLTLQIVFFVAWVRFYWVC